MVRCGPRGSRGPRGPRTYVYIQNLKVLNFHFFATFKFLLPLKKIQN